LCEFPWDALLFSPYTSEKVKAADHASNFDLDCLGVLGHFCDSEEETLEQGEGIAGGKKYQPEQVVNLLRQIEVAVANGNSTEQACRDAGIVEQTYYR
jgi:hypothetical protein